LPGAPLRASEREAGGPLTAKLHQNDIYVYDGANIIEDLVGATGAVQRTYTHGPGVDEPLAMQSGANTYFYLADGLGSIERLVKKNVTPSTATSETHSTSEWGDTLSSNIGNRFGFTGREYDSQTGLYYYRARYYDPAQGRFISEDPMRFGAGINFFGYVDNNPTAARDPFGLLGGFIGRDEGKRLSDCVKDILKQFFPGFDLDKIRLHQTPLLMGDTQAITDVNDIYYRPGFLDGSVRGIAEAAHEIQHSTQYEREGAWTFRRKYISEYIGGRWNGMDDHTAYENISYEREARAKGSEVLGTLANKFGLFGQPCKEVCK
jgi:RHS repeat-associated protein